MKSLRCIFLQLGLIQWVDHSLTIKELLQQRFSALNSPNFQYAVDLYCKLSILLYYVFRNIISASTIISVSIRMISIDKLINANNDLLLCYKSNGL